MPKPKAGRPAGPRYPVLKQLRLRDDDQADLKFLAELWRCSEAEAMRRVVRERAAQEKGAE